MRQTLVFFRKELQENFRNGKILIISIVFIIFGIMNPVTAQIMPLILEKMAPEMAEKGIQMVHIEVNALISWGQFCKNISTILPIFIFMFGNIFTKEYQEGTLQILLCKGLARAKVIIAKTAFLITLWTFLFSLYYGITYLYNGFYWDNGIAANLGITATYFYLFGIWIICLTILFSTLLNSAVAVISSLFGLLLTSYILSIIPKINIYSPFTLTTAGKLITNSQEPSAFSKAIIMTIITGSISLAASFPLLKKKEI